jgi:small subunit ribosomal protein S6
MNKYEIAVVLSANLEDEERASIIEKIKELVARFEGTVTGVDEWGKKRLAYEIQKQKEAFYYFVNFETENTDCPNEMEAQLRIMDHVLRYLVVKKEEA